VSPINFERFQALDHITADNIAETLLGQIDWIAANYFDQFNVSPVPLVHLEKLTTIISILGNHGRGSVEKSLAIIKLRTIDELKSWDINYGAGHTGEIPNEEIKRLKSLLELSDLLS